MPDKINKIFIAKPYGEKQHRKYNINNKWIVWLLHKSNWKI